MTTLDTNAFLASQDSDRIIDSGASSHMIGIRDLFTRLTKLSDIRSVAIADGRSCSMAGERVLHASSQITIDKVLFAPNFPVSLLSISAITEQLRCYVTFYPFHCTFQDLQTGRRIGLGLKRGNRVYLLVRDALPRGLAAVVSVAESSFLWHCRLRHPSPRRLQQTIPWVSLQSFNCESCQLGKHYRATFRHLSLSSSESPFALLHCDIWGPTLRSSISRYRYYIVFVDDYSRVSWVYLLKDRQHIFNVIKKKFYEIKNQFSILPKVFRTNNALEFLQTTLHDYCASNGILHQTSCAHTSQQNGVAERKYRHILDVACTIMFEKQVPKYLWSDAVLTATYLVNRMPSTPLEGEIPIKRLYRNQELFILPSKVFGCIAFVHNHTTSLDKLAPRSVKCMFVGYSRTQKGYRCFHPPTRRYIVHIGKYAISHILHLM